MHWQGKAQNLFYVFCHYWRNPRLLQAVSLFCYIYWDRYCGTFCRQQRLHFFCIY